MTVNTKPRNGSGSASGGGNGSNDGNRPKTSSGYYIEQAEKLLPEYERQVAEHNRVFNKMVRKVARMEQALIAHGILVDEPGNGISEA